MTVAVKSKLKNQKSPMYSVVGADLRSLKLLFLVLELIELPVYPALRQQLLVITDFAHLTFVHDDDLVGALNRGEAVSDDHGGAALDHAGERVADAQFGFRVHAGGGFIEHKD